MKLPAGLAYPFVKLGAKVFGRFDLDETSPIEAVKVTPVPILFIHGETDTFVPCDMSRHGHEANPAMTTLVTVPDAGHGLSYLVAPDSYLQAAGNFFSPLE